MPGCPLCLTVAAEIVEQFTSAQLLRIAPEKYRKILSEILEHVTLFRAKRCNNCHLIYFRPVVTGTERFYRLLSEDALYYMKDKPEYSLVAPFLPEPLRLLEVGCGAGYFADKLRGHIERYHGLEFNPEAVKAAAGRGWPVTAEQIEAFAARHAGEFNAVGSFQVLEHVADVRSFIASSLACLEEGGVFFLAVPNQDSFVGHAADKFMNLPPHHLTRWPRATLEALGDLFQLDTIGVVEEELADYHVEYYVRTCHDIGLAAQRGTTRRFVSEPFRSRAALSRIFNRLLLTPIVNRVVLGMRSCAPRATGHTIVGVYRKRCPLKARSS